LPRAKHRLDNFLKVIHLKRILAGAAAFVVTVIVSSAAAMALITRYPQLALRIFSGQRHDLPWGYYYGVDFPSWQIVIVGLFAFAITFAWLVSRASARRAG
jgi:hypothetical protein